MERTILLTGATGTVVTTLLPNLINSGIPVRALVHDPARSNFLRGKGVEVVEGEFSDYVAMKRAVEGVEKIVLITPPEPNSEAHASNVITAAKRSGNPHIIRVSYMKADENPPADITWQHQKTEEELKASGLPWTILRPQFFMHYLLNSIGSIREHGAMYWGVGEGRLGLLDVRDFASVIFKVIEGTGHEGKTYTLTGPESLTMNDVASALSEATGMSVTYIPVSPATVFQSTLSLGMGEWFAQVVKDYSRAYSEGWGDFTTKDVEMLIHRPARTIQEFASEVFAPALQPVLKF
jgi:uncharacterized protein YbjT (DUF2867 family)